MGVGQSQKPIERSLMRQTEVRGWAVGVGQSQKPIERSLMRQMEVRGLGSGGRAEPEAY